MSEQPAEQADRDTGQAGAAESQPVTPDLPPPPELADMSLDVPVAGDEATGRPAEDLDPDGAAPEPPA